MLNIYSNGYLHVPYPHKRIYISKKVRQNNHMNKKLLISYLGGTAEKAAIKLGYTHRNNIQRLSDTLTDSQVKTIKMRMRAARIKIPADW